MQYRPLGRTGLVVSAIGLGCAPMMSLSLEAGEQLVRRALDWGINYIDTARDYGETEVMVGRALVGQREHVYLSTKTGARKRDQAWRSIEESLQRLQTSYVDNCHLHALEQGEDLEARLGPGGALEALIEAREQGLVRHIGCTSHTSRTLLQALQRFDFGTILVPLNMVEREPLAELIPLCRQRGVGVTIMKPVATGLLPARLALRWLLNQPVDTIVPGATTIEEVDLDAEVGSLPDPALTAEEQSEADGWAAQLAHVRCRLCRACQQPCAQEINIGDELGSDVEYDHYRTMGPDGFAAAPWAADWMARDLEAKQLLVTRIEGCDRCGQCEAHCPYGLPVIDMLQAMLPGLRDMTRIYRERLQVKAA
jgi:aryl-alcohol dehydrogenase-like predicted oxidoreductase